MSQDHRGRAYGASGSRRMNADRLRDGEAAGGAGMSVEPATPAGLIARIESVPFSRWHIGPRIIMGSATFFDAFTALSLASAMPILVRQWGLSTVEVGVLLGP